MKKFVIFATLAAAITVPQVQAAGYCNSTWTGKIERLRIYNQGSNKNVFAYITPGNNDSYVGSTNNANMIDALFQNRNDTNGTQIQGYTDSDCKIQWIDY